MRWAPRLLCGVIPFPRPTTAWIIDVVALHGWPALLTVFFALLRLIAPDLLRFQFRDEVVTYLTKFPRRGVLSRKNLVRAVHNGHPTLVQIEATLAKGTVLVCRGVVGLPVQVRDEIG